MADQPIPKEVRDTAARWITARDAGTMSRQDEGDLTAWLAADPLHARAFAEAERFWERMNGEQVRAALRERYAGPVTAPATLRPHPRLSRPWIAPAMAASVAILVVSGVNDWPTRLRADAVTGAGEQRKVQLDDGSVAQLNTDSAIAVDYSRNRRTIRLLKGEVAFTVAPDKARPFTVQAGGGSTTALGTRFIVRRDGEDTDVTVTEHRVRVAWGPSATWVDLQEGEATRYGPDGIARVHPVDTDAVSGWTRGVLVFVNRPLGDVVAELNRYYPGYIRVIGAELAQRRVSGGFRIDDPLGAVDSLQRSLGIGSTRITNRLIFLHS